jgi:hypothetical protein
LTYDKKDRAPHFQNLYGGFIAIVEEDKKEFLKKGQKVIPEKLTDREVVESLPDRPPGARHRLLPQNHVWQK